jgi:hypothetical protein
MDDSGRMESLVLEFERAWQRGLPPDIADFIPRSGENDKWNCLLIELVCVDLEYRWRIASSTQTSPKWTLTDYVEKFRALRSLDELPLEVVEEEYRVRCRWGRRPSHEMFVERFKRRKAEILQRLGNVDRELHDEHDRGVTTPSGDNASGTPSRRRRSDPDPRAPLSFSDYLLQEMIGAGRMGKVYRSWQRSLERAVAVKYLRKSFQRNPDAVERFIHEAKLVLQFQHQGIVRIDGLGRTPGGGYFIAMDLIDGSDMSARLGGASIVVRDAVTWMMQACDAIGHAHERGIIHCDLKPANLLLDGNGNVRVTDFGLARSICEEARPFDRVEGTAAFMAPEQVSGWWGPISPQTDVYGIGAVFYALLTGVPPYRGATLADILAQVVSGVNVIPPIELRPDLSSTVNDICLRCLAKSPGDRYENMQRLTEALHESLAVT